MSNFKIQGNASGAGTLTLQSPNIAGNLSFTWASADGTNGQYLKTDGSGNLSFGTVSTAGFKQVLQVVKTDTFITTSTSYGLVTGLAQAITPSSASNKILVVASIQSGSNAGSNAGGAFRLYRDGSAVTGAQGNTAGSRTTAFGQAAAPASSAWFMKNNVLVYLDSPSTTSSTTYQIYARSEVVTGTLVNYAYDDTDSSDRVRLISTLTVMEFQP